MIYASNVRRSMVLNYIKCILLYIICDTRCEMKKKAARKYSFTHSICNSQSCKQRHHTFPLVSLILFYTKSNSVWSLNELYTIYTCVSSPVHANPLSLAVQQQSQVASTVTDYAVVPADIVLFGCCLKRV